MSRPFHELFPSLLYHRHNREYTANELTHQLEDSNARMLVTVGPFLDADREAAERAGIGDEVAVALEGR